MKKQTDVILYPAGAYGNFINWCHSYFSGKQDSIIVPFRDTGSVHNRFADDNRFVLSYKQIEDYVSSPTIHPVIQLHESLISANSRENLQSPDWFELFTSELDKLNQTFDSVLYVYPTNTSLSWFLNNSFYKVQPFKDIPEIVGISDTSNFLKHYGWSDQDIDIFKCTGVDRLRVILGYELGLEKFCQWGHSNINDFELWELRELSSTYFYDRCYARLLSADQISFLREQFKNFMFVELDHLRDNFVNTLKSILDFFELQSCETEIDIIYQQWLPKQDHIYKDQAINDIVNYTINGDDLDYRDFNLTFFDEIFIQRKLNDHGAELACFGMNEFPKSTTNLNNSIILK